MFDIQILIFYIEKGINEVDLIKLLIENFHY